MHTFAQKPKATQQTTFAKSTTSGPGYFSQSPELRSIHHLQSTLRNQAVPRMLEASAADGKGDSTTAGIARCGHDFSKIPVVRRDRGATTPSSDNNNSEIQSIVKHYQHTFSAAIRRVSTEFQSDPMSANGREQVMDIEAQPYKAHMVPPQRSVPEPDDQKTVRFPADLLQSVALPEQSDKIAATFGYKSSINQQDPPPGPGEFGTTRPVYVFEKPGPSATQTAGTFNVEGTIVAEITFQVAGPNRTDIASDADSDITQQNYPTVVSDLTPSPAAVKTGGVSLYKNQPPRTNFWAEDLTIKHECFHAVENVKFGQEGVRSAQDWLNKQTARTYDDVGTLLNRVTGIVAGKVDRKMALPGRELRAYADGAPDYLARAQAIKRKGDLGAYVPKSPAPQAPSSPPAATPKTPSTPSAKAPR